MKSTEEQKAIALFQLRLNRWSRLTREEIEATLKARFAPSLIYRELFRDIEQKKSRSVSLENFRNVMQDALKMLCRPEKIKELCETGYLRVDSLSVNHIYEIYRDTNGQYILALPSLTKLKSNIDKEETQFWKGSKIYNHVLFTFVIGSDIEGAFTLSAHGKKKCAEMEQAVRKIEKINSIFIQRALLGSLRTDGIKDKIEIRGMITPIGYRFSLEKRLNQPPSYETPLIPLFWVITCAARALASIHKQGWVYGYSLSSGVLLQKANSIIALTAFEGLIPDETLLGDPLKSIQLDLDNLKKLISNLLRLQLQQLSTQPAQPLNPDFIRLCLSLNSAQLKNTTKTIEYFLSRLEKSFPEPMKKCSLEVDRLEAKEKKEGVFAVSKPTRAEENQVVLSASQSFMQRLPPSYRGNHSAVLFPLPKNSDLVELKSGEELKTYIAAKPLNSIRNKHALNSAARQGFSQTAIMLCDYGRSRNMLNADDLIKAAEIAKQEGHVPLARQLLDRAAEAVLSSLSSLKKS